MSKRATWKPHEKHGDLTDRSDLPDSVFAFPKKRKEPLSDASHVRNALARFDQVEGVTDDERELAFANIKRRRFSCFSFGFPCLILQLPAFCTLPSHALLIGHEGSSLEDASGLSASVSMAHLILHLRRPGLHARGCHVIDAILGRL